MSCVDPFTGLFCSEIGEHLHGIFMSLALKVLILLQLTTGVHVIFTNKLESDKYESYVLPENAICTQLFLFFLTYYMSGIGYFTLTQPLQYHIYFHVTLREPTRV